MIDSHCHLDHEPLFTNINKVLNNSKKVGVEKILTISTTNDSYKNVKKLVELDPIIFGSIGIHPHETKNDRMNTDFIINEFKNNKKIIGVGETVLAIGEQLSRINPAVMTEIERRLSRMPGR